MTELCLVQLGPWAVAGIAGFVIVYLLGQRLLMSPVATIVARQDRLEANFRSRLIRVQAAAEQVCFCGGEQRYCTARVWLSVR